MSDRDAGETDAAPDAGDQGPAEAGQAVPADEASAEHEATEPGGAGRPGESDAKGGEETLALPPTTGADQPGSPQPSSASVLQGVPVPFAAPPSERNSGRFATALVLGIVGGLVMVGAIVFGMVYSLVALSDSLFGKVETTAEDFVEDLSEQDWNSAYGSLCPDLKDRPVDHYVDEWRSWDTEGAEVRGVRDSMDGTFVVVELGDGSTLELLFVIEQGEQMETSICDWEHRL